MQSCDVSGARRRGGSGCYPRPGHALVCSLVVALAMSPAPAHAEDPQPQSAQTTKSGADQPDKLTLETFLDRLMAAESGGNDQARNPRSTATGPFQFVNSTFLYVARRHFDEETAALTPSQILALRTKRSFARRAAEAYTKDNARHLVREGHEPSFTNLRLAYLVGPSGAVRVLGAEPDARVTAVLSSAALRANPFMRRMTVAELLEKCARDLEVDPQSTAGLIVDVEGAPKKRSRPKIKVNCNLARPSCRRWLALKEKKLKRIEAREAEKREASLP